MKVSSVLSLAEYDEWTQTCLPSKLPDLRNHDLRRRVGDSIYDYCVEPPRQRAGVHAEGNRATDLGGKNVLVSKHFYYFGNRPIQLPRHLSAIIHQTQGHKVSANDEYVQPFTRWIEGQNLTPNCLVGAPDLLDDIATRLYEHARVRRGCSIEDERVPEC